MEAKLTLKLNEKVIKRAKAYAANRKITLSKLIENYLDSLTQEQIDKWEISPFVKSISTGKSIPEDYDYKKDYINFLDKKYE
ncbi:MAG TPA: hypothetical protein DDZ96_09875 [Porphyromonadaceae bacterium]|jgi:hypothetical protein|nr:hypothetical protein [Porphyromonadaceae bacterium]HBK33284.1 hypothetical protein [Porphyromonadaceae bacterium]HBL34107.1 hypothetical protein [Porphyromonadaceae bacterium]HBX21047.1 hypothetical protein [Porphyromonadaceae bacterium]HCM20262.1 hypothetical protein [Porphyromonadaceae bacterium]